MHLFDGLSVSSILLLIALGLAITFGLMNVINMAHGEFIMIGAYTAYLVQKFFLSYVPEHLFNWYFILSLPIAFLLTAAIGWLLEVSVIKYLYGRPLDSLIVTWGISLILQQLARFLFGAQNVGIKSPTWLDGGWEVMDGVIFTYKRLFILALVVATDRKSVV